MIYLENEASLKPAHDQFRPLALLVFFAFYPREKNIDPIIPGKGLVMIYAARGRGKTHLRSALRMR